MIFAPAARNYATAVPWQQKHAQHTAPHQNNNCLTPPAGPVGGGIKPPERAVHVGAVHVGAANGGKPRAGVGCDAMNPPAAAHGGIKPLVGAGNGGVARPVGPGMGANLHAGVGHVGIRPPAGIVPGGLQAKMQHNVPFKQVRGAGFPPGNFAAAANQGFAPGGAVNCGAGANLLNVQPQLYNAPIRPPMQLGNVAPLRPRQFLAQPAHLVCAGLQAPRRRSSIEWATGTPAVKQQDTTLEQLTYFNVNDGDKEDEGDREAVSAVQLPDGILYESWISLKLVQFVDELELLLHLMFRRDMNLCTVSTCPVMNAGEFHNYSWSDGLPGRKPESVSAPTYIRSFIRYARNLFSDSYMFPIGHAPAGRTSVGAACDQKMRPSSIGDFEDPAYEWAALRATWGKYWEPDWKMSSPSKGHNAADATTGQVDSKLDSNSELDGKDSELELLVASFPPEFNYFVKQIMRRLFRIYCHIIRHHSSQLEVLKLYEPMMRGFKRVVLTVLIFNLLPEVELKAVDPLITDARELLRADEMAQEEMRAQQLNDPQKWEETVATQNELRERRHRAAQEKRREQRENPDAAPRMLVAWEHAEALAKTQAHAKAVADEETTPEAVAKAKARAQARAETDAKAEATAKRLSKASGLKKRWTIIR
eukprot:GEMP01012283.1.p1 GENE.GEMP01012283.1~~GEMP01012283.1.p1  ORF type:complete len:648 (+),score=169.69 GEMP01012283.1:314-2257(+)